MPETRKTRSPIKQHEGPLRNPGEQLLEQLHDLDSYEIGRWVAVGSMMLVLTLMEWSRWYFKSPPSPGSITVLSVVGIFLVGLQIRRIHKKAHSIQLGLQGEKAVGQFLERTRSLGYQVFHDIPSDRGNVDHVLVGPGGVFAIETKTASKPIGRDAKVVYDGERILVDGREHDRDPLRQARASAGRIKDIIENRTGQRVFVRPVVLYPGWWVDRQPKGVDVWVLSLGALPGFLANERTQLESKDISRIAAAISDEVRNSLA